MEAIDDVDQSSIRELWRQGDPRENGRKRIGESNHSQLSRNFALKDQQTNMLVAGEGYVVPWFCGYCCFKIKEFTKCVCADRIAVEKIGDVKERGELWEPHL